MRPKVLSKIVVFGGSGFIGSHVADQLSLVGHDVVIYDVFESPYLRVDQSMIIGDLLDPVSVASAVKGAQAVFNFAAVADINEALRDPVATVKINILGNVNILEACRLEHVDRIVYASSVYVNSREGGFYGCSKKAAEQYDPSTLANFSYDLARKFHRFYHEVRILSAETEEARSFRLELCNCISRVLEKSMYLLGINMPERM